MMWEVLAESQYDGIGEPSLVVETNVRAAQDEKNRRYYQAVSMA
jgi:hypothetical protein